MKPLFSSDEEAKAASVPSTIPVPACHRVGAIARSCLDAGHAADCASRGERGSRGPGRYLRIDDKAIESLGGSTGAGVTKVSAKLLSTVRASDADVFGTQLNELIATSKGLDPAKLRSGGLLSRVTNMFGSVKEKMLSQYQVVESPGWTPWFRK